MSIFARISALAGRNISISVGTAVEAVDFVRGNSEIHRFALKFNISLALRARTPQPGTGARGAESARTPEVVGCERRGGRKQRAGREVENYMVNQCRRSVLQPLSW